MRAPVLARAYYLSGLLPVLAPVKSNLLKVRMAAVRMGVAKSNPLKVRMAASVAECIALVLNWKGQKIEKCPELLWAKKT
jgi:hypothetical protein